MSSGGTPVVTWAVGLHSGRKVQHALKTHCLILGLARTCLGLGGDSISFILSPWAGKVSNTLLVS